MTSDKMLLTTAFCLGTACGIPLMSNNVSRNFMIVPAVVLGLVSIAKFEREHKKLEKEREKLQKERSKLEKERTEFEKERTNIIQNFSYKIIAECTCEETKQVRCDRHDPRLLKKFARHISNDDLLYDLGMRLNLHVDFIEACLRDNKQSINRAAYEMLRDWYNHEDGLGKKSSGLTELKQALTEIRRTDLLRYVDPEVGTLETE